MAASEWQRGLYRLAADGVLLVHFLFVAFALLGGLLLGRWPALAWAHLPVFLWAGLIMIIGWRCPLTPLEKWLRQRGGERGYRGGFVEHYLLPLIGRRELTPKLQTGLGWAVLGVNMVVYGVQIFHLSSTR
ncbi:MAG: DUF2784 domain-containing protein [Gammaproteobacteria bacterium]